MIHSNIDRAVIGFNGRHKEGVVIAERFEVRRGRERRIVTISFRDGVEDIDARFVDFDFDWAAPIPLVQHLGG